MIHDLGMGSERWRKAQLPTLIFKEELVSFFTLNVLVSVIWESHPKPHSETIQWKRDSEMIVSLPVYPFLIIVQDDFTA